jgi:hypothetical protein
MENSIFLTIDIKFAIVGQQGENRKNKNKAKNKFDQLSHNEPERG